MEKYISKKFHKIKDNSFSSSEKLVYDDLIDFSIGDPDIHTDINIIEAAFNDTKKGYTHYTDSSGILELREEICKYQNEEYGLDVSPDEVFITTSACHAMYLTMQALLDEGDEIIIPTPHFSVYDFCAKINGAKVVYLPTYQEEDFQINIDRLEKLINKKTKAIIINTPNNPTGTCLTKKTLNDIAFIAKKYDILVIADDIYTLLSFENPFIPISSIEKMKERTITLRSFSKDFMMTGWRIGYIIADKELLRVIKAINDNIIYSAPSISQRAALHALKLRNSIQLKVKEEFKERLDLAYQRIQKIPKLKVLKIKGTFYIFVNIKETNMKADEFCKKIAENCHINVISGTAFGNYSDDFVRLSMRLSKDKINEAFDRIEKWLN